VPVGPDVTARAREGDWQIVLTPIKPVPRAWFPAVMPGVRILCLASGGGQQGPILAAAGATVTVFDNSPLQLAQDRAVAERDQLALATVEGDMADLSAFPDGAFDLVFNPVSNCFIPDVRPVWRECYRVLRAGGVLLAGFINPVVYLLDKQREAQRILQIKYKVPYSDLTSLDDAERARYTSYNAPLEFGHSLSDQLGGQMDAGFVLTGFYEDDWGGRELVDQHLPSFMASRAMKL
jgi:SAM-dependent methyltransferase